ncbi:MAG TPA: hypothetical protein VGC65_01335 [Bacteroidia bacterium]|jgi:hypothetical protein
MKKILPLGEWIILGLLSLIALSPLFSSAWYHTGDGPFHLYSAAILNDLLFHSGEAFGRFFDLHFIPVPNTTILIFQAILLEVLPPNIVSILTILLISICIIGGYLYFIKAVNPDHKGVALLVLPVVINFFTIMGFFSFLASVALLFFTIGYFHKKVTSINRRQIVILTFLITLNWFTHFIGALFSIGYIAFYILLMGKNGWRKIKLLIIISLPFVLLSIIFGMEASKANVLHFESFNSLLALFKETSPIICYSSNEMLFMRFFQYLILFSFPLSLYYFFKRGLSPALFAPLGFCFVLILGFFIIPTNCLSVKFINIRVLYAALLFFCAFIEMYSPRYLMILTLPVVLFVLVKKKDYQTPIVEGYSLAAENISKNSVLLPKGKAVIALNYSDNWLEYNMCLYPAVIHKTVILDNEEASTFNSVIRWKKEKKPGSNIGDVLSSKRPTIKLDYEKEANEKVEGLFMWRYNPEQQDLSTKSNDSIITKLFKPVSLEDGVSVYLRK